MRWALAAWLLLSAVHTAALSAENAIVGAGSVQCKELPAQQGASRLITISWVQGFVSGANAMQAVHSDELMLLPSLVEIAAFVNDFCATNPDGTVYRAATRLVGNLQRRAERRPVK